MCFATEQIKHNFAKAIDNKDHKDLQNEFQKVPQTLIKLFMQQKTKR